MVSTPNFTDGTWSVAATLHRDGDPNGDILWQNLLDQSLVLWEQDGAETLSVAALPSLTGLEARVVGDFDGDGRGDAWLQNAAGNNVIQLSSTNSIVNTTNITANRVASAAAELTGDGRDDMVFLNTTNGGLTVWEMDGATRVAQSFITTGYTAGDDLHSVFNGDAVDTFDSLWFDDSTGEFNITSYNSGLEFVTDSFNVGTGRTYENTADYDGDGDPDFLFLDKVGSGAGSADLVFSNGIIETGRMTFGSNAFGGIRIEAGGDFDDDGIAELFMREPISGESFLANAVVGLDTATTMMGSDGIDVMDGRSGDDRMLGFGGDDLLFGGEGEDVMDGGEGDDWLKGSSRDDELLGGAGDDFLEGEFGNDILEGGDGDDLISTGPDYDVASGGAGSDRILGSTSASNSFDHMRGDGGDDFLLAAAARSLQEGGAGNDLLSGGSSLDHLFGDSGDDVLIGGFNFDDLDGGSGNDVLIGPDIFGDSTQTDTLAGGSGRDFFVLGNQDKSYYAGSGLAVIEDFSTFDYVVLNGISSDYDVVQNGADVEIRFDGTVDLVADIKNEALATVNANVIFMG